MRLRNTSTHPDFEVQELAEFATRGVNMSQVAVNVKGGRRFQGHAYNGVPSISNVPPTAKFLVTINLPATGGRLDEPQGYGGRRPDEVGPRG